MITYIGGAIRKRQVLIACGGWTRRGCCTPHREEGVQSSKRQTRQCVGGDPVGGAGEKSITGRCIWLGNKAAERDLPEATRNLWGGCGVCIWLRNAICSPFWVP